jgi:hypothetical protein
VGDSREGWVESLKLLLAAHFEGRPRPSFDYSAVRPRGAPIKGFGGTASGPEVLQRLHEDVDAILGPLAGRPVSITAIVDVMNAIGRCVVSGDVRQTAEIAFGPPDSDEYIDLKVRRGAKTAWNCGVAARPLRLPRPAPTVRCAGLRGQPAARGVGLDVQQLRLCGAGAVL